MSVLECKNVTKEYRTESGSMKAVSSFSASFPNKGMVAIQGKSGSGKSTLLCLLSALESPTSGDVLYKGESIKRMNARKKEKYLREEIAFVYQHYGLFEDKTVYENIALPVRMLGMKFQKSLKSISFLLEHFGLKGYEKRIVGTLSGGEKQRVAIIRAIIKEPKILFADEPTGALDEKNGTEVMKMLSALSENHLVILVSHNFDLVKQYADRIITLKDGKKIEDKIVRENKKDSEIEKEKGRSGLWIAPFLKGFVKEDFKRNVLTFFCGFLGLSSILLSLGYMAGEKEAIEQNSSRSLEYLSANISRKEKIPVLNSPLVLTRQSKPSLEETNLYLSSLSDYTIADDLSYFLPEDSSYRLEEQDYADASFIPIFDISLNEYGQNLVKRETEIEGEGCYVNGEFYKAHPDILGKEITITLQKPLKNSNIADEFHFVYKFKIKGVVEEFSFLNTPKIYYRYGLLEEEISTYRLECFSTAFHRDFYIRDFLDIYAGDYLGRDYKVFFHDFSMMKEAFALMGQDGELALESQPYVAYSSFASLSEAFKMCLLLLLSISLFGLVGVTAMSFLSLFIKRKEKVALLLSFGASKGEIVSIFLLESFGLSTLYSSLCFALYPLLQRGFNAVFAANFGMNGVIGLPMTLGILGVNIPTFALAYLALLLIAFASSALPILLSMRKGLREELRDE